MLAKRRRKGETKKQKEKVMNKLQGRRDSAWVRKSPSNPSLQATCVPGNQKKIKPDLMVLYDAANPKLV